MEARRSGQRAVRLIQNSSRLIAVIVAPGYLGIDGYLSMNSFEPVLWMGCLLAVILVVRGQYPRWWIAAGILGGLGLENKPARDNLCLPGCESLAEHHMTTAKALDVKFVFSSGPEPESSQVTDSFFRVKCKLLVGKLLEVR
jgi:hypothetical protein